MIADLETGWLYASASGPQTNFVDLTFELPNIAVVATTAASAFSAGVHQGVPGSVATYIREYGVFTGPYAIKVVDLPPDPANNNCYVEHCAFVRFRLTVFQATAWSLACVFRFAPAPVPPPAPPNPRGRLRLIEYAITDGATGGKLGDHRVFALRRDSRLDVESLVRRSTAEAAAHFGIPRRRLTFARRRVPRRPPRPATQQVF